MSLAAEARPVEAAKAAHPVKVLDAEAIRASGARNLGELMAKHLPGQVLPGGGPGAPTTLHLGGSRPEDVMVLLDGLRLSDAAGTGSINPASLSLEGIERVEVVSGPSSTLYGAHAMGGVIALFTVRNLKPGLAFAHGTSQGTQGHRQAQTSTAYGWTGGWVRTGLQSMEERPPTETARPYRDVSTFVGLGQTVGEGLLTLTYRTFYLGVPSPYLDANDGPLPRDPLVYSGTRQNTLRNEQIGGTYRVALNPAFSLELLLGQSSQDRHQGRTDTDAGIRYQSRASQGGAKLHWKPQPTLDASLLLEVSKEVGTLPSYTDLDLLVGQDRGTGQRQSLALETTWDAPEGQQLTSPTVTRRPFTTFGVNGFYALGPLRLGGNVHHIGPRYEKNYIVAAGGRQATTNVFAYKAGFNDLGLWATWTLRHGLSLGLRGEHVLQPRLTKADWLARTYDFRTNANLIQGLPSQGPVWSIEARYRH